MFLFADVYRQIIRSLGFTNDHSFVNIHTCTNEQNAPFFGIL